MNLWAIFLTGLTTGGLACIAVQGGLLAGFISSQHLNAKNEPLQSGAVLKILSFFLASKLVVHILFGMLLGGMGSAFKLSLELQLGFQVLASLYMLASAGNLLDLHPIFRYANLQTPRWIARRISKYGKQDSWFVPIGLGAFTVFIPCGITQAMEVLALNSGDPLLGGAILGTFVLGTIPLFSLVAVTSHALSNHWDRRLRLVTALLLVFLSLYGINGVLTVLDSPLAGQKIWKQLRSIGEPPEWYTAASGPSGLSESEFAPLVNGTQIVNIEVKNNGYVPNKFVVRKGVPVKLTVRTNGVYSCASSFVMRKYKLAANLQPVDSQTFTFTPDEKGVFTFSCSMGMYGGSMEVRE